MTGSLLFTELIYYLLETRIQWETTPKALAPSKLSICAYRTLPTRTLLYSFLGLCIRSLAVKNVFDFYTRAPSNKSKGRKYWQWQGSEVWSRKGWVLVLYLVASPVCVVGNESVVPAEECPVQALKSIVASIPGRQLINLGHKGQVANSLT